MIHRRNHVMNHVMNGFGIGMIITAALFAAACGQSVETPPPGIDTMVTAAFTDEPGADWVWIRENPMGNRNTPVGLEILVEPGGLMGAENTARNILTRTIPEGVNGVWVTVTHRPESQYEQAGLIVYHDDDNYIKLVHEYVGGDIKLIYIVQIDATPRLSGEAPWDIDVARIGLRWDNDRLMAYYIDPETGEEVLFGEDEYPMTPSPHVGVFAQSGVADSDRWALFSDFNLE